MNLPKKRRQKRRRVSTSIHAAPKEPTDEKNRRNMRDLFKDFNFVSLEEVNLTCRDSKGDSNMADEILARTFENASVREDQSTTCSSSSGNDTMSSSSNSLASEAFDSFNDYPLDRFNDRNKHKSWKVIAAAGTVSTVLGKDYVRSSKSKGYHDEARNKEETEQFLCTMLGEECELGLDVIRDVLGQCGYDLHKALDVLLELSATSKDQANGGYGSAVGEDVSHQYKLNHTSTDITSETATGSFEAKNNNPWFTGNRFRSISIVSGSNESHVSLESGNSELDLPQKVLESLFNMPTPKTAECKPSTMNWRNVVKKMASLRPDFGPDLSNQGELISAKDEYLVHRSTANRHWESMKSYYQKASTAFTNGSKGHAAYLSQQGRLHSRMAREADEKASQDIFTARNKSIENVMTIDLHGQHVKQAMRLLKLHLLFGAFVQSVRTFKVITGCGSHKVKNSVIGLLKKEGIAWSEENRGMLLIRLNGQNQQFRFLECDSENE